MRPVEKDPPDGSAGISFQFPHFRHLVHRGTRLSRAMNAESRTGTHVDQAHYLPERARRRFLLKSAKRRRGRASPTAGRAQYTLLTAYNDREPLGTRRFA